jgi:hypothetical protein
MKYIFVIVATLLLGTGCTKKEFKTNFHNIKDGTEKRWDNVKEDFSEKTKEYKDN